MVVTVWEESSFHPKGAEPERLLPRTPAPLPGQLRFLPRRAGNVKLLHQNYTQRSHNSY